MVWNDWIFDKLVNRNQETSSSWLFIETGIQGFEATQGIFISLFYNWHLCEG